MRLRRQFQHLTVPPSDFFSCDYFALFGLPKAADLDGDSLRDKYRQLQAAAHPDRFAGASDSDKRAALQMASRVNDGYQILQNPLRRAAYLLELRGITAFAEDNTAMPPAFLMQQLEWREALESADGDERDNILQDVIRARDDAAAQTFALLKNEDDAAAAADSIRQWKYLEKMLAETAGD